MNTSILNTRISLLFLSLTLLPMLTLAIDNPPNKTPLPVVNLSLIDSQTNPCDDFYKFSCGNWLSKTTIPGDETNWYRFSEIDLQTEKILTDILKRYQVGDYTPRVPYAEKIGNFYATCMDESLSYSTGKKALHLLLQKIQGVNSPKDFATVIGQLHRTGIDVLFSFSVDQDSKFATQMISDFGSGGTSLPEKSYYTDSSPSGKELLKQFQKHIEVMLKLSGVYSENEAKYFSQKIFAIESTLAKYSLAADEQRDPLKLYNPKSWDEFYKISPQFHWASYLKEIGLPQLVGPSKYKLNVIEPEFYKGLNLILSKTPMVDLKAYTIWKTLSKTASLSSKELNEASFNFFGKTLYGQKEESPRWKKCLKQVNQHLGEALGEAFVQVAFGQEAKEFVSTMTTQIIEEMRSTVSNLEWLDNSTKEGAYRKLNSLVRKIGYPDHFRNYDSLTVSKTSLFANWISTNQFDFDRMVHMLDKPVDRSLWGMTPQTNNAYYNPTLNEIVFPAGILQTPLFNVNSSDAANIGATGATIGHELTHGFDDEGRQYDENGNLNNWWTSQVETSFNSKAQCLIEKYNGYSIVNDQDPTKPKQDDNPSFHLNGKLTLGENIADLGGLKLALTVFLKKHPNAFSEIGAGNQNYSDAQIFFISYAQSWCGKITFEALKNQIASDPHSPPEFRVNGVVTNLNEFADAFQCHQGSNMNPVNKCSIW